MPLSEHEQQLLDQLERQLHAEDPAFARALDGSHAAGPRASSPVPVGRVVLGVLVALVGLAGVLAGVAAKLVLLGALGFVLMVAGVLVATHRGSRNGRGSARISTGTAAGTRTRAPRQRSSFMEKLEERWEDRRGGF